MTAEELREMAEWLRLDDTEQHDRAAGYLFACADALDAGPVAWHYDGRDHISVYTLAMPGALRLPEPMTDAEQDALLVGRGFTGNMRLVHGVGPYDVDEATPHGREVIREIESEVLRRVKEANK